MVFATSASECEADETPARVQGFDGTVSGYWSTAALDGSGLVCNDSKEMIEFHQFDQFRRGDAMLAEKFILLLEALIKSAQYPDGSYRVKNTSPHVPVELPTKK